MTIQVPPPAPSTPSARDGGKVALVAAIVVSALLLVGVAATALVLALGGSEANGDGNGNGNGGSAPAAQSPEEAVREFLDASNDLDCTVLAEHPITDFRSVETCEEQVEEAREQAEDSDLDFDSFAVEVDDLEVTSEDDDIATVLVEMTHTYAVAGEDTSYSTTSEFELERDGDRWVVVQDVHENADPALPADPVGPDGE
ncbi:hypothetical protein [Aeromicrobium alkaliterrae]|uniref:Nuclear transport factor 2 family protein n=1 Tax=Aeromicrobium alkaliterrae TaxID=302168 RepID=A0ABN2JHX3_9ACTN